MHGKSALFVCFGNTCRSPIAEACFKKLLDERGLLSQWNVDSAGTSRNRLGSEPSLRGQQCMKSHDIYEYVSDHRARQITTQDFDEYDYIFTMDDRNMNDLRYMAPKVAFKAKVSLLGSFDNDKTFRGIIKDPYFSDCDEDFEVVYEQCARSCTNFLEGILKDESSTH